MNIMQIKEYIINQLSTLPVYKPNYSHIQHVVRCPYCGDSIKSTRSAHFSIKIDPTNDFPMLYRCFRCDASGLFSMETLDDLGLNSTREISDNLKRYNRSAKRILRRYNIFTEAPEMFIPLEESTPLNDQKLEYLNGRLGTNYSYGDLRDRKVITNLYDFIKINEITHIEGISPKKIDFLNKNYIGFLSSNNNVIHLRNITSNDTFRRHDKIILNQRVFNPNTFYTVPRSFDFLYTNEIDVHIAEGISDILSIKDNLHVEDERDNFYFSSCTFGYTHILRYLLNTGINTGMRLHIYADNDKDDYIIRKNLNKMNRVLPIWCNDIKLHRNLMKDEKDYGVTLERIDDRYKRFTL